PGPPAEQVNVGPHVTRGKRDKVNDRVKVKTINSGPNGFGVPHIGPQFPHAWRQCSRGRLSPVKHVQVDVVVVDRFARAGRRDDPGTADEENLELAHAPTLARRAQNLLTWMLPSPTWTPLASLIVTLYL